MFILVIVVLTIKVLINLHDVGKRPSTFREVQHFALDFGERDVFPLSFLDNLGDEELFGFPSAVECLHVADFTPVPSGRWDGWRTSPYHLSTCSRHARRRSRRGVRQ